MSHNNRFVTAQSTVMKYRSTNFRYQRRLQSIQFFRLRYRMQSHLCFHDKHTLQSDMGENSTAWEILSFKSTSQRLHCSDGHHRFVFLIVCCLTEAMAMFPYIFKKLWRIKETPITTAKDQMHIHSNHLSNDLLMHHKPLAHDATVLKNSYILRLGPP